MPKGATRSRNPYKTRSSKSKDILKTAEVNKTRLAKKKRTEHEDSPIYFES